MTSLAEAFGLGRGCFGREGVLRCTGTFPGSYRHAIPTDVIERRFKAGLRNFESLYRPLVNEWQRIDNGGAIPQLLS